MNNKPRKLDDGRVIPLMGMGTSRIIDEIGNIKNIIYQSIKDGVRLISYKCGHEEEVGEAIKQALDEKICKREELIIIGKVWAHFTKDPEKALRETLQKLKLDYIDVYMGSWPNKFYFDKFDGISIYEFWPKMEKLVELGLAKSLGVYNYNIQCLSNLLFFCKIRPAMIGVVYNLFYIRNNLKEFCHRENIPLIAFYPLHKMGNFDEPEFDIFNNDLIKSLAKKYMKKPVQIILNWHYCHGTIPIPNVSHKWMMKENLESLSFKLDEEDFKNLSKNFKLISLKRF